MSQSFKYFDLKLLNPPFDSSLTDTIMWLEKLRHVTQISTDVHPVIFEQLKQIFHLLESLESVRIEGNNTTLSEVVEHSIDGSLARDESEKIKELRNIDNALKFVDEHVNRDTKFNRQLISEIHKIIVQGLDPKKDGDGTPGVYRTIEVSIKNSLHKPPRPELVAGYMEDLFDFINEKRNQKYQLLVTAQSHHRFVWIHPFKNGNGRVVRLFTYALLKKHGYAIQGILNPTAVFCNDRNEYYRMLSEADKGSDEGLLTWCSYVLDNLLEEIKKIEKLLNYKYLESKILLPALNLALERKHITMTEYQILKIGFNKGLIQAKDINMIVKKKYASEVSRIIKRLCNDKLLEKITSKQRKYKPSFFNNYLLRDVIQMLKKEKFVPIEE